MMPTPTSPTPHQPERRSAHRVQGPESSTLGLQQVPLAGLHKGLQRLGARLDTQTSRGSSNIWKLGDASFTTPSGHQRGRASVQNLGGGTLAGILQAVVRAGVPAPLVAAVMLLEGGALHPGDHGDVHRLARWLKKHKPVLTSPERQRLALAGYMADRTLGEDEGPLSPGKAEPEGPSGGRSSGPPELTYKGADLGRLVGPGAAHLFATALRHAETGEWPGSPLALVSLTRRVAMELLASGHVARKQKGGYWRYSEHGLYEAGEAALWAYERRHGTRDLARAIGGLNTEDRRAYSRSIGPALSDFMSAALRLAEGFDEGSGNTGSVKPSARIQRYFERPLPADPEAQALLAVLRECRSDRTLLVDDAALHYESPQDSDNPRLWRATSEALRDIAAAARDPFLRGLRARDGARELFRPTPPTVPATKGAPEGPEEEPMTQTKAITVPTDDADAQQRARELIAQDVARRANERTLADLMREAAEPADDATFPGESHRVVELLLRLARAMRVDPVFRGYQLDPLATLERITKSAEARQ